MGLVFVCHLCHHLEAMKNARAVEHLGLTLNSLGRLYTRRDLIAGQPQPIADALNLGVVPPDDNQSPLGNVTPLRQPEQDEFIASGLTRQATVSQPAAELVVRAFRPLPGQIISFQQPEATTVLQTTLNFASPRAAGLPSGTVDSTTTIYWLG
jgi:hypothetical protein